MSDADDVCTPQTMVSERAGRRGGGPRTPLGKAAASGNSRKHGLFGKGSEAGAAAPRMAAVLAGLTADTTPDSWDDGLIYCESALIAAGRLQQASALVHALHRELGAAIEDPATTSGALGLMIGQLVRLRRYEHRFRGTRDRALRRARRCAAARANGNE